MRFFMNRHYSTAQKIINNVEEKIITSLTRHPKIVRADQYYDVLTFSIDVANKRKLAGILGDVLKDNLPNSLYEKYQRLKENEKKELRETIVVDYFMSLKSFTANLNNIDINISAKRDTLGDDVYAKISLPKEFFDKDKISHELRHSISLAQQELMTAENDVLTFQNYAL